MRGFGYNRYLIKEKPSHNTEKAPENFLNKCQT